MAVRRLAEPHLQPKDFAFTAENLEWAKGQIAKYPDGRHASAVIPLLWRAQEQAGGWGPEAAIRYVADLLRMAHIPVLEVATFYTMFNLAPIGRWHVQLCGTTPCELRGAGAPATTQQGGPTLGAREPKKADEAANVSEPPIPKPPIADSSDPRRA